MILYKPSCATNFSACYEPILLTHEEAKISFSGRHGCWPQAPGPSTGREGVPASLKGLLCWSLRLLCLGRDCHFQNEFSLSHLILPKQAVSPHRFCDD